ncbi:MAG: hypothetical protein JSW71_06460 [Gemmatimonadota bacterium]|nr:MAG: hypothetical protein JSW71_06460 [Gemmatimonadota bacterium]
MRRTVRVAATAVLTAIVVGCGGNGPDRDTFSIRDSAGVTIVVNTGDPGSWTEWHISSAPELILGASDDDPENALYRVVGALRLSDGRVAVGNAGSFEVRYFAPDGRFLYAAGQEGAGPGEFSNIEWITLLSADSVVAYDSRQQRLTVLDPAGKYVRSMPIRATDEVLVPVVVGLFGDGSALIRNPHPPPEQTGVYRIDFRLYRYEAGVSSPHPLGVFAGDDRYFRLIEGALSVYGVPFARSYVLDVVDTIFYHGHNEHSELRAYSPTGRLLRLIRWDAPPVEVTDEAVRQFREAQLNRTQNPDLRRRWEQVLAGIPANRTMPKFGASYLLRGVAGLIHDEIGNLWVLQYAWRPGQATRWSVFDKRGVALATVTLSPRHEPLQVGDEFMLLRFRDSLDVETVRLHKISKGG